MLAPIAALRETLYTEMLGRIKQTDLSVPYRDGGFFQLAVGQSFMGLGTFQVSDDGNLLAYSLDTTGFRQYALFVKDLRTGRVLPDRAARTGSVAWAADSRTLFYTVEDAAKRQYRLYRHALGGPDTLLYEERDERFRVGVSRTRSDAFLVLAVGSLTTSEAWVLAADQPTGRFRLIARRLPGADRDDLLQRQPGAVPRAGEVRGAPADPQDRREPAGVRDQHGCGARRRVGPLRPPARRTSVGETAGVTAADGARGSPAGARRPSPGSPGPRSSPRC